MINKELLEKIKMYVEDKSETKIVLFNGEVITDFQYTEDVLYFETLFNSNVGNTYSLSYLNNTDFIFALIEK